VSNLRKEDNEWHWEQKGVEHWLDDGIVHFIFEGKVPAFFCNGHFVQEDTGIVLTTKTYPDSWEYEIDCDADYNFGIGFDDYNY